MRVAVISANLGSSTGYVYRITNIVNGKQYVGQTTQTVSERWRMHVRLAKEGRQNCRLLFAAIRKYGESVFSVETVETISGSQAMLDAAECRWIEALNVRVPNGYNIRGGGSGGTLSDETRAKISAANRGRPVTQEMRDRISATLTGRKTGPPSAATRARISAAFTPERRAKMRALMLARNAATRALGRSVNEAANRARWKTGASA